MALNQWFEKAMSADDYIEKMEKNKEGLLHIYDTFNLPDHTDLYENIREKNLRAIVLTEDWCGDAMLNVPILLRIAEKANIDVRMLLRDDNLELMDQYLTNGKSRSIPIFIFINEEGNEVAKWGPRAAKVQEFIDESRAALPPKDAPDHEEKANEMYKFIGKSFRDNQDFWDEVYNSLINKLKSI
ncbi:thioredoxin family protein [Oceanobacillus luteolus]|uniref:Thioredoxin family protein n=1 Tax=Oceanobacillus luteolus TaxID=1274358 RepID=A0ABW4HP26_9BACI|nr:thioredoxin family protein [Oceanobacillus luteolus]MCM3740193.1 thioredoxin family protein [Oceanobacillus luteolus]